MGSFMPKLAIYVPKKDMRQIEKWRKKINFSRVFMRALLAEIRERERAGKPSKKGEKQMVEAAAHYRQELVAQGSVALDDEELMDIAFANFRSVYDNFTTGMSKSVKIRSIVDYCRRHDKLGQL